VKTLIQYTSFSLSRSTTFNTHVFYCHAHRIFYVFHNMDWSTTWYICSCLTWGRKKILVYSMYVCMYVCIVLVTDMMMSLILECQVLFPNTNKEKIQKIRNVLNQLAYIPGFIKSFGVTITSIWRKCSIFRDHLCFIITK